MGSLERYGSKNTKTLVSKVTLNSAYRHSVETQAIGTQSLENPYTNDFNESRFSGDPETPLFPHKLPLKPRIAPRQQHIQVNFGDKMLRRSFADTKQTLAHSLLNKTVGSDQINHICENM